ncbi:SDR family oxidoreductase [Flaviflagellibacter deserti]|uniref:SDR family oxidoreductase n=1 Tax=Flaviflagellibacter deserti TaxID=2267266 RepID=A0ABV9Z2U3_9HYPH
MPRFTNKRVLITGGTSGIGLAGAKRIVDEGGQVLVTGLNERRLDESRRAIPTAAVLRNDAADPSSADELAARVQSIGKLDGLWLNAGYAAVGTVEEVTADFFDRMMSANVRGPVLQLARLSHLINEGGSVVVTSSTSTYEGAGMASVYSATKGALVALARCWASALAPRGIRVNVLVPGPIETNFRDFMADDLRASFEASVVSNVALGRIGSAEEAAAVALFLLSDDSSYVTGSQYAVDGGLTMR